MNLRRELVLKTYIKSSTNKDVIIIKDTHYYISSRLKRRLDLRDSITFIQILIMGMVFKWLIGKGLDKIIPSKPLRSLLFLLVGMVVIIFTSNILIFKDIGNDLIEKPDYS